MKNIVRLKNNGFVPALTSALLLVISSSFNAAQNQDKQWEGHWEALWQIKNAAYADSDDIMRGYMEFKSNGQMKITAYGYPGCLFSNDTIYNELSWKAIGDSLVLYSDQDKFNLIYTIRKASSDEVLLQLMDDIFVTLKR